ncbi:3-hydroxyacyl-CoA dehydrogenase NAD-binding domain-containing protein [Streptomyces sennicomposti]
MAVVTIVGAGVIGVSWARLFDRAGWEVRVSDPRPDLRELVERELPGRPVTVTDDLAAAEAYGTGEAAYARLARRRDERTRAVLGPLGWPEPASRDGGRATADQD